LTLWIHVFELALVRVPALNDPVIHAHALLAGTGTIRIILDDLRDPEVILAGARDSLDFTKPVALPLAAIPHFIPDAEDPVGLVTAYRDALPPGSFLVLSHGTSDFHPASVTGSAACDIFDYQGRRSKLAFRDSYIQDVPDSPPVRTHVGIDRVSGGARDSLLFRPSRSPPTSCTCGSTRLSRWNPGFATWSGMSCATLRTA
jgi:hypothetical protein